MSTEMLLIGLLVCLALAALIGWLLWRRQNPLERDIRKLTRIASTAALKDILLPNGMGGEIYIAHLLYTERGLLLLDPRDVRGLIFAGDKMQEWSATLNGTRVSFENPIPALLDRLAAVRAIAQGVPVEGRVVFHNSVTFPKGHPPSVATVAQLIEQYTPTSQQDPQPYQDQWQALEQSAKLQAN